MGTIDYDSSESEDEEEEEVETQLKILASRDLSSEANSKHDECNDMSSREIQFNGSNNDHIELGCFNYNCSAGLEIMIKSESFTFHNGEEEASLGNEPRQDITLFQNEVKKMFLNTTHNQIIETTIDLKASQDFYSNHSDEIKEHTEGELSFQKVKEELSPTWEQIPPVMEDKFSDISEISTIQTQIDGIVQDGWFRSTINVVVTAYDSNLCDIAHRGSVVIDPIAHLCCPSIQAFTQEECYIQTMLIEESKSHDQLVMMNQREVESKLGVNLKVTIVKREKFVEAVTQGGVHLQYQIEKTYKLHFSDELRDKVLMKFEEVQKYCNELRKDDIVAGTKSSGNGYANGYERDEQESNVNIVSN